MKNSFLPAALVCAALPAPAPARAIDVWDSATEDDNGTGTDNGAVHGTLQIHDLAAEGGAREGVAVPDQDWYVFQNTARSSYEVLIDGTTSTAPPARSSAPPRTRSARASCW